MTKTILGIKIESDFEDYYDSLSVDNNYAAVYKRFKTEESRGTVIKWLKERGTKTIDLKAAREYDDSTKLLVVYTNPKLHDSQGKRIVPIHEARIMYSNQLASKFYTEANGVTIKFLQIGTRRFRLTMKSDDIQSLNEGTTIDITELSPELNYAIMEPIFSIDYISNGNEMIAVDFNKVQKLSKLGIESIMNPEQVITEVKKSLIAYNKL